MAKTAVKKDAVATFIRRKRIEVTIGRTINLGDFESTKINVTVAQYIPEDAEEAVFYEDMINEAETQVDEYLSKFEGEEEAPPEEEEEVPEEEEGEEITEEAINVMSKKDLVTFCKETEGLEDINVKLVIKGLRKAVIDALFVEEEEEEVPEEEGAGEGSDDEWQDTDWED